MVNLTDKHIQLSIFFNIIILLQILQYKFLQSLILKNKEMSWRWSNDIWIQVLLLIP